MSDTANYDRPRETPQPPEGYETWLNWILDQLTNCYGSDTGIWNGDLDRARAELAALRAKAAAYQEAMNLLAETPRMLGHSCHWDMTGGSGRGCPQCILQTEIASRVRVFRDVEIASGRFKP